MLRHLTTLIAVIISVTLYSQTYELGVFAGASSYNGDLTEKNINLNEINPAGGIFGRINFNEYFSLSGNLTYGRLTGTDENNTSPYLQARNLSFRNDIYEFAIQTEFNFMELNYYYNSFTPYVFTGLSGFMHNPQALHNGRYVDLQPLGTEGQGTSAFPQRQPYGLSQIAVPFGAGFKFLVGDNLIIGMEGGFRKTFTDYIDDVSKTYVDPQVLKAENGSLAVAMSNPSEEMNVSNGTTRGGSESMDMFWFGGAKISYRFGSTYRYGFLRAFFDGNKDQNDVPQLGKF